MADAAVHVVDYDEGWPALFLRERDLLTNALRGFVVGSIEHVGSTAVVGLSAKPVIDIMVGVETLAASERAKHLVRDLGYRYAEYKTDLMHWFCKPSFEHRTHHLHLVPHESALWRERLAFRDALRGDPALAAEYGTLKRELAERYRFDREAYTDAKWPFIARVLGCRAER